MIARAIIRSVRFLCAVGVGAAHAYEVRTHSKISENAFQASVAEMYLTQQLGIPTDQKFDIGSRTDEDNNGTARGWIQEGRYARMMISAVEWLFVTRTTFTIRSSAPRILVDTATRASP